MISSLADLWNTLFGKKDSYEATQYGHCYLPIVRSNEALDDNRSYIESIVHQIDTVRMHMPLNSKTRILDFGCGQGRLANGLIYERVEIAKYIGIDTHKASVDWCQNWIEKYAKKFHFAHLSAKNERYNPTAKSLRELPFGDESFDLAFLNSVFSHMMDGDVKFYLTELHRVLNTNGLIYITAFIEDEVENVEENPEGYLGKKSFGSLHRVRYERSFFMEMLKCAGFIEITVDHRGIERTKQSVVIARKGDIK